MPETNALPDPDDIMFVRADLDDKLPDNMTIEQWMGEALLQVKRDLEDKRAIKWAQVYDEANDAYYDNEDATGRNEDRIQMMIKLSTVSSVFEQYANTRGEDSQWWQFFESYQAKYIDLLTHARLDFDVDQDGEVDKEGVLGQASFCK